MPVTSQKNLVATGAAADLGLSASPDVEQQLLAQDALEQKKKKVQQAIETGSTGVNPGLGALGASSMLGL